MSATTPSSLRIRAGSFETNCHDVGAGKPVLMIHGSGPGVSGWANWRLAIPTGDERRVLAPDMVGFGYHRPAGGHRLPYRDLGPATLDLLDALDLERADLVGNSFGAALSLALPSRTPSVCGGSC